MNTTRRDFLKYCGISAAALGLTASDLLHLSDAMANPNGPGVLWLQGSGCTGCSISLLNRISTDAPKTAAELLINSINLVYHPNLMSAAGGTALSALDTAYAKGGYVLAVEGGVPTAFGGAAGWLMTDASGNDVTIADAVQRYAARAAQIVCMGTCASWGGVPATGPNPTAVKSVGAFLGKKTINIGGCPAHPDWMVWPIVQVMLGKAIRTDSYGRPTAIFSDRVHANCPLRGTSMAQTWGEANHCLKSLGCQGPQTTAPCPVQKWNNGVNFCTTSGSPCLSCTSASFPGPGPFRKSLG